MQHVPGATVNPFSAFTDSVLTNVLGASTSYAHLQGGKQKQRGAARPASPPQPLRGAVRV